MNNNVMTEKQLRGSHERCQQRTSCGHETADTSKVKILFIIDFLLHLSGGTENQLVKLLNNLDKSKYELHLILMRDTDWVRENVKNLSCSVNVFDIIKLRNVKNIITFVKIIKCIKTINPNVVMTFFPLSNIIGVIAAHLAKVPVILSTRRDYGLWLNWEHKLTIYALKYANRFVRNIVVNANIIRELTSKEEKFDPSRIDVIYNGVDIHGNMPDERQSSKLRAELGIPDGSCVIGTVAGLKPMKRHEIFLSAANRMLKIRKDVHFLIVGDGPLRAFLEAKAAEINVEDRVHFVGAQVDVIPYLSLLTIGVNCSANEGLSNAIMEYMAYGVPCVVSDAGGNPELIEHDVNGYVFKLNDDEALSRMMLELLGDEAKRQRFTRNSREKILRMMTMGKMIANYEKYFDHMIAASR